MKLIGDKKLLRKFNRLQKKTARSAMRAAVRAGTAIVAREVKKNVPVDKKILKANQGSKVSVKGERASGVIGADVAKLKAAHKAAGGNKNKRPTNQDHLVEYGHMGADGTFVPPSGYMRRSADTAMPRASAKAEQVLAEKIEKGAMQS